MSSMSPQKMKVKYKLCASNAIPPKRMTNGAAGFDLYASCVRPAFQHDINHLKYDTDVAFEIPSGHVGLVFPRSSVCKTALRLSNCVGVIDSDYRGTVSFVYDRRGIGTVYRVGERIGQIVFVKLPEVELEEVEELSPTDRGRGGYGSTGK